GLTSIGGGHTTDQSGYFGSRLCEAEDIVDKEQNVFTLFITEVFRDSKTGQSYAQTGARRLVHLTEDHSKTIDNACTSHFMVEVVTFTSALTYTCEDAIATMAFGDIIDELLNDNGLANTGTTEGTDLTAFHKGTDKVDNFDTSLEDLDVGRLIFQAR